MSKCKVKKPDGTPCKMQPLKGEAYCFAHAPETAAAREVARKLGGYNRHTQHAGDSSKIPAEIKTIADVGTILRYTLDELLEMDNSIPRARALIAVAAGYIDTIKTGELEVQLKELLAVLRAREVNT